jgi:hypothetical protein
MSSKRRNPKKNKAARRPRPARPDGLRQARLHLDQVHRLLAGASPDALPLMAVAAVWLWNLAEDGEAAAHCVDCCLTLHYALAEYGIGSRVEAVGLDLHGNGRHTRYGSQDGPRYNADGTFNGHAVLVVPGAGKFIDPTLQQYREVPDSEQARRPLLAPLPVPGGLGSAPFGIERGDHQVIYAPVPGSQREAWRNPGTAAHTADYQRAGANLAAHVLALLRTDLLRARTAQSPYPRLRTLLAALDGTEPVAGSDGIRFRDLVSGSELRLADIPDDACFDDEPRTPGTVPASGTGGDITERQLISGWAAAPDVRVRQAVPADLGAVGELAARAGVQLEDELASAVTAGTAGGALRAGLRSGRDGFARHIAEQFLAHPGEPVHAYLSAALILVAEHREHGVAGALIAYPPSNITAEHLKHTRRAITDPRERGKLMMAGAIGVAKIKAVAVTASARGLGIGGSLLQGCQQVYFHCGYLMIYGQMPTVPGLAAFYRRNGFQVLDERAGLDMWVVFGVHSHIHADKGERFFIRQAPG